MSDQNTPVPDPAQPAQPGPAAPAPPEWRGGGGSTASNAAQSGPRRWWNEATSTGGGRAALAGVAVLGVLLLVTGLGLVTAFAVNQRGGDDRGFFSSTRGGQNTGPGADGWKGQGDNRQRNDGKGDRPGSDRQGNGRHQADGGDAPFGPANPANPANPGQGTAPGRGLAGLGAVLHGEFTTAVTGTPTVMVVQTGQVTAYTAGKSLKVKSTDGYEATYTLDATTSVAGRGGEPAVGVQVRVLAAKDGMKATALVVGG